MIEIEIDPKDIEYQIMPFFIDSKLVFFYLEENKSFLIFHNNSFLIKEKKFEQDEKIKIQVPNTLEEQQDIIITFEYLLQRLSLHENILVENHGEFKTQNILKIISRYILNYKKNTSFIEMISFESC